MGIRLVISESTAVAGSNTTTFVANVNKRAMFDFECVNDGVYRLVV